MSNAAIRAILTVACVALVGCRSNEKPQARSAAVVPPAADTQPAHASRREIPDQGREYTRLLVEVEGQIRDTPNDPMPYYRRCQYLMILGQYEEGYRAAKTAMGKFTAAQNDLSWMLIDTMDLGSHRVDVHFNMGPDERQPPEIGMTRPLSFRVWTKAPDSSLVRIIDYEVSYFDGEPATTAFGEKTPQMHLNYGIATIEMTYQEIREAAKGLIAELVGKAK